MELCQSVPRAAEMRVLVRGLLATFLVSRPRVLRKVKEGQS